LSALCYGLLELQVTWIP